MATYETARPRARLPGLPVDPWRIAPVLVAAVLAGFYLLIAPKTGDLPAHVFRAKLFGREPFTVWNGDWYSGHHTPAYSVLFPPLAWMLGPAAAGALAAVGASAAFEPLARGYFGESARWGTLWFGFASATILLTGRLPFMLGVALGLVALLAYQRGRIPLALVFGVLCPLASPVAGVFLAIAAFACVLARQPWPPRLDREAWQGSRAALWLTAAAVVPPLPLVLAFPEGGKEPYVLSSFLPVPIACAFFLALVPRRERALRAGAAVYALVAVAALAVQTPVGGNASRLGALFAGPLAACLLLGRGRPGMRPIALVGLFVPLVYWQWSTAVREVSHAHGDLSRHSSYFHPLLRFLSAHKSPPGRVEVVFTRGHWETANVAIHFPLARGWERQLDIGRDKIFYNRKLFTPRSYEHWLGVNGVRWVALPDAPLDYSAKEEARLVDVGVPYLKERWFNEHWRVYEVTSPRPLVLPEGGARIKPVELGSNQMKLQVQRPGSALVRVRWTPYWVAKGACLEPAGAWTRVTARHAGPLRIHVDFSPLRLIQRGRRCS